MLLSEHSRRLRRHSQRYRHKSMPITNLTNNRRSLSNALVLRPVMPSHFSRCEGPTTPNDHSKSSNHQQHQLLSSALDDVVETVDAKVPKTSAASLVTGAPCSPTSSKTMTTAMMKTPISSTASSSSSSSKSLMTIADEHESGLTLWTNPDPNRRRHESVESFFRRHDKEDRGINPRREAVAVFEGSRAYRKPSASLIVSPTSTPIWQSRRIRILQLRQYEVESAPQLKREIMRQLENVNDKNAADHEADAAATDSWRIDLNGVHIRAGVLSVLLHQFMLGEYRILRVSALYLNRTHLDNTALDILRQFLIETVHLRTLTLAEVFMNNHGDGTMPNKKRSLYMLRQTLLPALCANQRSQYY